MPIGLLLLSSPQKFPSILKTAVGTCGSLRLPQKLLVLRANGLLTNWVSVAKTVRADPEPVEGSKHGRVFITSTAVFKVNHIDRKMFESKHE